MNKYKSIIILLITALSSVTFAQTGINSPYSRYGLGQLYSENMNTVTMSMGGLGFAIHDPTVLNPSNPASYGSLDSSSFLFEVGIAGNMTTLRTATQKENGYDVTLGYIYAGFPISKWWRSGIGIMPYSKIGYNVEVLIEVPNFSDVIHSFTGNGGLNKVFWGNGFNITRNLRAGVDFTYVFGNSSRTSMIYYPDSVFILGTKVESSVRAGDFIFEYGLQYDLNLSEKTVATIGLVYANQSNMSAKFNYLSKTVLGGFLEEVEYTKDTIEFRPEEKGEIVIPQKFGAGIAIKSGNNWMIGADFEWQNWEKFAVKGVSDSLINSWRVTIGGEFMPKHSNISPLYKRMVYRAGVKYNQSYLNFFGTPINEFGISFGFGFPLKNSKTGIDVGMEIGRRGTTVNNLIQENYFNFSLGISIQENWFQKRKYR